MGRPMSQGAEPRSVMRGERTTGTPSPSVAMSPVSARAARRQAEGGRQAEAGRTDGARQRRDHHRVQLELAGLSELAQQRVDLARLLLPCLGQLVVLGVDGLRADVVPGLAVAEEQHALRCGHGAVLRARGPLPASVSEAHWPGDLAE